MFVSPGQMFVSLALFLFGNIIFLSTKCGSGIHDSSTDIIFGTKRVAGIGDLLADGFSVSKGISSSSSGIISLSTSTSALDIKDKQH